ncbi:OsmC family protein [Gilvimarinus agarilyticus]|uniref:OsmC family protein n=1 Tax=Gilvimarinus sp. 2_MG-2023 TaxID=3062666 RepID=UPI001C08C8B0|nr:OsmC family protein [Gilvimarinus sp. 2_MG-2023]MBU2886563.1 OsmC family protein [Gilvimarinus agarilyticus]MDO6571231.1 OsmC family protein [Gilvimarinus sp. 2_MG-2023]
MVQLPHQYVATVTGKPTQQLTSSADNLPDLSVAPPAQFDGPGDQWSPEALLMASVASCLILSFRAIAKAAQLHWCDICCESEGVLDKVERKIQFTQVLSKVTLTIAADENKEKAATLIEKAERSCFISNSLSSQTQVMYDIKQTDAE